MEKWTEILEEYGTIDVVYCDFQKAFDTVPHKRLLNILKCYGFNGNVLTWIKDFLTSRKQQVKVNESTSSMFDVTSGLPQGSVLGPILFVIYINTLVDKVENSELTLYADDLKLYKEISSEKDTHDLQKDIDNLFDWTKLSLLKFHPATCEVMRIQSKWKKTAINNAYQIDRSNSVLSMQDTRSWNHFYKNIDI